MNRFESLFKSLTWIMALLLAAFVAGCGGGGGGEDGGPTAAGENASLMARTRVARDSHDGPGTSTKPPITSTTSVGPKPVNLGTAGNFVVLSKAGISTVTGSLVTGDIGVSPIAQTAITGFSQTTDRSNTFSTSAQVLGKIYAADYAAPTPTKMTTAVSNMETAYTDAAGRTLPGFTELGAGHIGGLTLVPGLYKWGTGVSISTNVTLSGSATDVWIFQIAGNLTQASATKVILAGGALAKNIFWQVGGGAGATIGTTAHFEGTILSKTAINVQTGASANGRLLAQTAVNLQTNAITQPSL
jgi:hypothetical protein